MKVSQEVNYTIRMNSSQKAKLQKYSKKSKMPVADYLEKLIDNDNAMHRKKLKPTTDINELHAEISIELKQVNAKLDIMKAEMLKLDTMKKAIELDKLK